MTTPKGSSAKKSSPRSNAVEKRLERIAKGFANYRRIQILRLIEAEPELSLSDICERLGMISQNGSEHLRKLNVAGLVMKRRQSYRFRHKITDRGRHILAFLDTIT